MASELVAFRFPDGTQFRMLAEIPEVGTVVRNDGARWTIAEVDRDAHGNSVVMLQPVDEGSALSEGELLLR